MAPITIEGIGRKGEIVVVGLRGQGHELREVVVGKKTFLVQSYREGGCVLGQDNKGSRFLDVTLHPRQFIKITVSRFPWLPRLGGEEVIFGGF